MVRFCTNDYVRSHMREPRGTGVWAFQFDTANDNWFTPNALSYTEARAAARREAVVRRAKIVRVQP